MDPPWYTDGARGAHLLSAAREAGLESLVAKRLTHQYRLGQRSREWIKTALERTTEAIISVPR